MCVKAAEGKWGGVRGHKLFVIWLGVEKISGETVGIVKILLTRMKMYPINDPSLKQQFESITRYKTV